ncbi:MAG: class I SAM-dependent methyltransferase [Magnetospiraceae bacterium]
MTSAPQTVFGRFGPYQSPEGWVPAPSYIMRRAAILREIAGLPPGRALEIGCGSGALLVDMHRHGFQVSGLETADQARRVAQAMIAPWPEIALHDAPEPDWQATFDCLFAFEVLEHIEEDRDALAQWLTWLKPGGQVLLSVPAHRAKWSVSDDWAGHVRRYDADDFRALANAVGLEKIRLSYYGFPLSNMVSPLRDWRNRAALKAENDGLSQARRTARSGVERTAERRFYPLIGSYLGAAVVRVMTQLQYLSRKRPWGTGLLLSAQKAES